MSPGQQKLLIWAALILFVAYLADVNLGHLVVAFLSGIQQIHNSNAHP